jgi:hypothetical protein
VTEPSTEWREVVQPDETERHKQQAAGFVEMQQRKSAKYGTGRALHRKQVAALRATLDVPSDLPDHARQGIFKIPNRYDAWIRLSNGGFNRAPDSTPDIRGFSIKVLGVSGPAALGGEAVSQDFALINRNTFSSATSDDFAKLVLTGGSTPGGAVLRLLKNPGLLPKLSAVSKAFKLPFSGFATHDFFSAAPIAFGPYAARVRLLAASDQVNPAASDDWATDIYDRLIDNPLSYQLQMQFFIDESSTPIEDATSDWAAAPFVTVGRLTVPRQKPDEALATQVEAARFDPWNALTDHRPLGEVMRARKVAYFASQQARSAE